MITVAVCDDEKYLMDQIRKLVSEFFRGKNTEASVVCFSNGEDRKSVV